MNPLFRPFLVAAILTVPVFGENGQQVLAHLSDQLQSVRVERVEILCVPRYILSDQRMTPELLRNDYSYKLTIPRFNTSD